MISVGVPTAAALVIIGFAASAFSKGRNESSNNLRGNSIASEMYEDLYGDSSSSSGPSSLPFSLPGRSKKSSLPRNAGIPEKSYLRITNINSILESYDFSVSSATESKASAASVQRERNFDRAVDKVFAKELTPRQKKDLVILENIFLKEGSVMLEELEKLQRTSVERSLNTWLDKLRKEDDELSSEEQDEGVIDAEIVNGTSSNSTSSSSSSGGVMEKVQNVMNPEKRQLDKQLSEISKINSDLAKLELNFMKDVMTAVGTDRAAMVSALWVGNVVDGNGIGGSLIKSIKERPLSKLLGSSDSMVSTRKPSLFVASFPGDVSASQVTGLREEVTAIIRASKPGDEALVVLQSGGGTVTGYGLAAAQLQRLKQNGIRLTICVEQVAASGGYMMTCVADHVVASPFAVLGSIGVITDIPNAYERLKKEGIEFQTITAGKFKRTVTPTKKPTKEDLDKTKADLEDVLTLFKGFVAENRPQLDIDAVATGETWFGQDALDRKLCDEIRTKDDVLVEYVDKGFNVFEVEYDPPVEFSGGLLPIGAEAGNGGKSGIGSSILRWLTKSVVSAVREELSLEDGMNSASKVSRKTMMRDERDSSSIRFED
eukprot:CAMPEP_0178950576 /NCGR_PEP_ID=MMETSP0789-20121207/6734_1 /TAXON_ID=3005 /ORGANISM="Rhizosolenia setigera, Strain CCMP 1694" /LENGTH=601 /DNA_ID=CAMNT_0020631327 /DNA_START=224 /DNA_END=2029 /DNA_ORIENTATION=-